MTRLGGKGKQGAQGWVAGLTRVGVPEKVTVKPRLGGPQGLAKWTRGTRREAEQRGWA